MNHVFQPLLPLVAERSDLFFMRFTISWSVNTRGALLFQFRIFCYIYLIRYVGGQIMVWMLSLLDIDYQFLLIKMSFRGSPISF